MPAGSATFAVTATAALSVGQATQWVAYMGMDKLVRYGAAQTWVAPGYVVNAERTITGIGVDAAGRPTITVDALMSDSFNATLGIVGYISAYSVVGRLDRIGLESFRARVPSQTAGLTSCSLDTCIWELINIAQAQNAWIVDVAGEEFSQGFVISGRYITVDRCSVSRVGDVNGDSGWPFHYSVDGQQVLVMRSASSFSNSSTSGTIFSYATQKGSAGAPFSCSDPTAVNALWRGCLQELSHWPVLRLCPLLPRTKRAP